MSNIHSKLNVLIVDDEKIIRNEIKDFFCDKPYMVYEAEKPSTAFDILENEEIDIVILDVKLPEMNGIEVLKKIKKKYPGIEVIMITGHGDNEILLSALRYGAFDFFHKPIRLFDLNNSIERTNRFIKLNNKIKILEKNYSLISKELEKNIGNIIGKNEGIKSVIKLALKAADSPDTSVIIMGESGTGKELVAKTLHYASKRKNYPFLTINCSAVPENLIESEFFGHIKGSFTGAIDNKTGIFEDANGGTVFLDEIGDMPLVAQSKLLRVLEDRKVKKIGSNKETKVDVRVAAATNKDIQEMIKNKQFRDDLYFRLNTIEIKIPPLRNRKDDIPLIINYYVNQYSNKLNKPIKKIADEVFEFLSEYDFPGNIRELKNMIERAIIICDSDILTKEYFSIFNLKKNETADFKENEKQLNLNDVEDLNLNTLYEMEKKMIIEALNRAKNKKIKAAELLGISRFTLDRKMKKYNI